jgi:hypothetical protein
VTHNIDKMDYPRYRRLGLPTSSAPVESQIKQFNRRVKGTEKFWTEEGAEAVLQVRAAYLSQDGRAERNWAMPRPHYRAVGRNRLAPVSREERLLSCTLGRSGGGPEPLDSPSRMPLAW